MDTLVAMFTAHMSHRSQMSPHSVLCSTPASRRHWHSLVPGLASSGQVLALATRCRWTELATAAQVSGDTGAKRCPAPATDDKKPPFPILGSEKADFAKGSKWLKTKEAQARERSNLRRLEASPCKKGNFNCSETCQTVEVSKKRIYHHA